MIDQGGIMDSETKMFKLKNADKKFRFAVKGIIHRDDKYLITKKSSIEDVDPNGYDTVGGNVEFGESIEEALTREVLEEVNLKIKIFKPINAWTFVVKENEQLAGVTYLCEYVSGEVKLSHEHDEFYWLTKEEILSGSYPEWLKKEISLL